MRYAFHFDQTRCMCCNTCTVACKDWNQVNPGPVRWRGADTYETGTTLGEKTLLTLSMSCNHCEDPACKKACSFNAIEQSEDGIVYVDRSKCQNLQACISACPFAAPHLAGDKQEPTKKSAWKINHPMQKCDFCKERLDKGQEPICVASCVCHALDFGDYDELLNKYPTAVRLNSNDFPYAYVNNKNDTKPALLITKHTPPKITKAI